MIHNQYLQIYISCEDDYNLVGNIPIGAYCSITNQIDIQFISSLEIEKYGMNKAIESRVIALSLLFGYKKAVYYSNIKVKRIKYLEKISKKEININLQEAVDMAREREIDSLPASFKALKESKGAMCEEFYISLSSIEERDISLPPIIIKSHLIKTSLDLILKKEEREIPIWLKKLLPINQVVK